MSDRDNRTFEERMAEAGGDPMRELCVLYQMRAEQLNEISERQRQDVERLEAMQKSSETNKEALLFIEAQLVPLATEGSKGTFMGVPVTQLSREALLGLIGHLGREQAKQDESRERERAMWKDIARAGRRG